MKSKILLLALTAALLSSCTTSYKSGQTPDDVYYSRAQAKEYVETRKDDDRQYRDDAYYEDQYLRMKVRDRYRWSDIDDPYYYSRRYNSSAYNCCCFGNPWTPSSYWNSYYNPYYNSPIIINPKTSVVYRSPRTFNLNSYNNSNALTNSNYSNPKVTGGRTYNNNNGNNTYSQPRYNNSNSNSNSGNILREVFRPGNNNSSSGSSSSSSGSSNNNSSSSSSGSSGSSSSSSSSSPAPVRKF